MRHGLLIFWLRACADGVRNPIVSTVLYLSEGVGGPTLVTTQHLQDTMLAARGWLAFPKLNRLVAFDGSYLHGVVPGRPSGMVRSPSSSPKPN